MDLNYADIRVATVIEGITAGVSSGAKIAGTAARIAKASTKPAKAGKAILKNSDEIIKATVDISDEMV